MRTMNWWSGRMCTTDLGRNGTCISAHASLSWFSGTLVNPSLWPRCCAGDPSGSAVIPCRPFESRAQQLGLFMLSVVVSIHPHSALYISPPPSPTPTTVTKYIISHPIHIPKEYPTPTPAFPMGTQLPACCPYKPDLLDPHRPSPPHRPSSVGSAAYSK